MFLRQCDESVTLGLYRDASRSQTPLDPESPSTQFSRGTSPFRKNLRYEAKELVRSLQSSRTSLEKAGLGSQPGSYSSGTLGRRRGRPFSPANQLNTQRSTQNLSSAGHLAPGSPVPTVESPVTPHNTSAPPSLGVTQAFNSLNLEGRLCIEEVDAASGIPDHSDYYIGDEEDNYDRLCPVQIRSIPNSPLPARQSAVMNNNQQSRSLPRGMQMSQCPLPTRPKDLNLSNSMKKKRQGYIFSPSSIPSDF